MAVKKKLCSFPACPRCHQQVYFFIGIKAYFFWVPVYAKDQVRQPALWTKLLDSWTFHQEVAIIRVLEPQPTLL